jgi:AcrR family transcriptional regulator
VNRRRPYRSTRREQQAEQTRLLVLAAARKLFEERGYAGTSMAAVADEAGVSPESVYAHFGSKRSLLGELFRHAVRGADPAPVPEQDVPRRLAATSDRQEQLKLFAADIVPRLERAAPLVAVLAAAAQSDPELALLLATLHADRLKNLQVLVDALAANGPLRLPAADALETVWALTSPELFQLLTRLRGWTPGGYGEWLAGSLKELLLPERGLSPS